MKSISRPDRNSISNKEDKAFFNKRLIYSDPVMQIRFLELFYKFIIYYRDSKLPRERRNSVTIQAYLNKRNIIIEYLEANNIEGIICNKINNDFADSLLTWLLSEKKYSNNYAARIVDLCGLVLAWGKRKKIIRTNNLSDYTTYKTGPEEPTYLSPKQIKAFHELKYSDETMQKALDMAIIQLNTCIDYGDFEEIKEKQIITFKGRQYLIKGRNKNNSKAIIPLTPLTLALFEKYNYMLCLLSNPEYNLALKTIARDLGIKPDLGSKDLRKIAIMHNLNNEGMSIEAASKIAGHKKISTTETYYAQVNLSLISNELDRLGK